MIVVVMGQDCEEHLKICLESVKKAEKIIYVDGGTTKDMSVKVAMQYGAQVLVKRFDKEDILANSKQRQFYLDFLKKEHMYKMCLVLDADEFVEDFDFLQKDFDKITMEEIVFSVKMRHFINNFAWEDATSNEHYVLNRIFRITENVYYPDGEHAFLRNSKLVSYDNKYDCTTIWHLSYVSNMFDIRKKYLNHVKKSEIHSRQYLDNWYRQHLFAQYPMRQIDIRELPTLLLKEFHIDKDEIYFANRNLEVKHFIDSANWKEFFKCQTAVEWGCGRGPRVAAMKYNKIDAVGLELSDWAICNPVLNNLILYKGDITKDLTFPEKDLVIAYDVLEHISYEDLDSAINTLIKSTNKHILISVPVIGDPNLENDKTHIIKETKDWWRQKFLNKGLKEITVPDYFLFKEQQMIFEKV